MRSDVQNAALRIQQYDRLYNEKDTPGLGVTTFQVCRRSRVLPSADLSLPQGTPAPDVRLAIQHIDTADLRGTINTMARLIEEHGIAELQRVGVLSQEGGMRRVQTRRGDVSLTCCCRVAITGDHCGS